MTRITSAAAIVLALTGAASAQIVPSNNAAPGDFFNNPTTTTSNPLSPGAAVGASGWFYTNVRNDGTVGINNTLPRSGNGSVFFSGTQGPAGNSSKADIEYFSVDGQGHPVPMGTLGSMNSFSYDWHRVSGGTAGDHYHPALRFYFDADGSNATTNDRGYLVFERAYNPAVSPVPVDQWVSDDVFNFNGAGSSANLWMVNFGNPNGSVLEVFNRDLNDWLTTPNPNAAYPTLSANTVIYGLSAGIGSGWGTFSGAVDNIAIGFTGALSYNFNFEVVPAPGAIALLGLGGLFAARRRRD
jgi:hypothetical protein